MPVKGGNQDYAHSVTTAEGTELTLDLNKSPGPFHVGLWMEHHFLNVPGRAGLPSLDSVITCWEGSESQNRLERIFKDQRMGKGKPYSSRASILNSDVSNPKPLCSPFTLETAPRVCSG